MLPIILRVLWQVSLRNAGLSQDKSVSPLTDFFEPLMPPHTKPPGAGEYETVPNRNLS